MSDLAKFPALEPLPTHRERELLLAYKAGDKNAERMIVLTNQRYVLALAGKYGRRRTDLQDLVQAGNVGLMIALMRFDVTREVRFVTYAKHWIAMMMREWMQETRRMVRVPPTSLRGMMAAGRADEVMTSECEYEDFSESREAPIPVRVDETRMRERVRAALRTLPERQLMLIVRHYWHDETLSEIGESWGVTRQRVQQIEAQAINRIRVELRRIHDDYLREAA
jgi:RNA polymerase sigma factor (sigma-70 family)